MARLALAPAASDRIFCIPKDAAWPNRSFILNSVKHLKSKDPKPSKTVVAAANPRVMHVVFIVVQLLLTSEAFSIRSICWGPNNILWFVEEMYMD